MKAPPRLHTERPLQKILPSLLPFTTKENELLSPARVQTCFVDIWNLPFKFRVCVLVKICLMPFALVYSSAENSRPVLSLTPELLSFHRIVTPQAPFSPSSLFSSLVVSRPSNPAREIQGFEP